MDTRLTQREETPPILLGELHQEIIANQGARFDLWKWKIGLIAGLSAVGLGIGIERGAARVPLVLCCIPFVCAYIDILSRHISVRSHAIGAWRLRRQPRDPFYGWEWFKDRHLMGVWWLEDLAKYGSSTVANLGVALVGLRVRGVDGAVLLGCGLAGIFLTAVIWILGRRLHRRIRELEDVAFSSPAEAEDLQTAREKGALANNQMQRPAPSEAERRR